MDPSWLTRISKYGKEFKLKSPKMRNRCLKMIRDLRVCLTVDFAETEIHFPIKHSILQNSRFQIHPGENKDPVKKHDNESSTWQHSSNTTKFALFSEFCK